LTVVSIGKITCIYSFTSPSQDLNVSASKIIVSNPQQQQQAILKELKCLFVDMVSKASQTVLLQEYRVVLSEFPNVIFRSSVEKSMMMMMMMISAKHTWCGGCGGGGGGAKLNSEIKANVLSPLHYVQVMCNHVQLPMMNYEQEE
jgi:NADH pyrophosphatase NudC (nudix superfamily)